MKELIIFDLDGTLLNSIRDLGNACNHALAEMGLPTHPIQAYPYMVGNGVRTLIQRTCPDADAETLNELYRRFKEYYDVHNIDETVPYEGICELLNDLKAAGINIAIASNKYQEATEKIVHHFFPDIPFVSIQGQIEGRQVTPDPSIVFAILSEWPTPKSKVMYVGDSAVDIETARRACVESIGVTWGFRAVSELRQACADHIVSTPREILNLLLQE